jgi:hypothetical protein
MSRPILILIVLILLVGGCAYYLSSSVREVPAETIEAEVSRDPASR